VGVIDTSSYEQYAILAFDVGNSPLSQSFTFNLDNSLMPPVVWVAAFLDVDGGGTQNITGVDVLGWYASAPIVAEVSTATSRSGLDFALPTGEIHGTVTFVPGQDGAELWVTPHSQCLQGSLSHFGPPVKTTGTGPYAIIGVYAGTYCLFANGSGSIPGRYLVCYGDYSCVDPTPVTIGQGEVRNGVNISFVDTSPAERTTWGTLKSRYP
jgi:hypothetical protein